MATYKVIQDIEAEDKLIGPLSLRQFIYAAIVIVSGFIAFKLAYVSLLFVIPFLPVIIFFGLLAAPLGRDQPNEIWLLARISFFVKPRVKKWNQAGASNLVTITIPKKVERKLTKDYTEVEVQSRLKALANTIDSRGWAIKNVNANLYSQPAYIAASPTSDRLIDPNAMPGEVPNFAVTAQDDIFEDVNQNNQKITQMLTDNKATQKKRFQDLVNNPPAKKDELKPDYWFMNQTKNGAKPQAYNDSNYAPRANVAYGLSTPIDVGTYSSPITQQPANQVNATDAANSQLKVFIPVPTPPPAPTPPPIAPVTTQPDYAKIETLARDNNRSLASLAREADEAKKLDNPVEVIVSLR